MNKNTKKNTGGVTGKGFDVSGQPSPEAKSAGWGRRREAQKILDEFMAKGDMTYKEIKELIDDIKVHPENHTLREVKIANYLMSTKYTIDWLDRHISKAPTQMDIKGNIGINDILKAFDKDPDDKGEDYDEKPTS